ncbi:Pkinase-domain-containing protein [Hortaea werneckii]|nr:Pkinase-domain-containing protein [Hortaea werneckii]
MSGDLSLSQSLGGLRIANPDSDDEDVASPPTSPAARTQSTAETTPQPTASSHSSSGSTVTASSRAPGLLPTLSQNSSFQDDTGSIGTGDGGLGWDPGAYTLQHAISRGQPSPRASYQSERPAVLDGQANGYLGPRQAQDLSQRPSQQFDRPAAMQSPYGTTPPQHYTGSGPIPRQPSISGPMQSGRPYSSMYMHPNSSSASSHMSQGSYRYRDEMGSSDGSHSGLGRTGSRSARGIMAGALGREGSRAYRQGSVPPMNGNGPPPPKRNSRRSRAPTGGSGGPRYDSDAPYGPGAPTPRTAEEWRERGAAVSKTQTPDPSGGPPTTRLLKKGVKDFNFGRTLGEGSYSTVLAATDRQTLKEYAIKVLDKRHIIKEKKVKYVNIERDTLNRLTEHPGVVRLYYTFQDERSLYFVLDLCAGGELLGVLKRLGRMEMEGARFYGSQILDSVAYMHSRGVIHRDLKPENVLLDGGMHVKITDFGTAKLLADPQKASNGTSDTGDGVPSGDPLGDAEHDRAVSFVGTAEYVSPELLRDKTACRASDLWAFGCIVYQLLAGRPPFKAANEYLTFQKILGLEYTFPDGFPDVARDLVERLLVLEPERRMTVENVKAHPFFEGVQWGSGLWRQKAPRLKSYEPPPREPIKLNGVNNGGAAAGAAAAMGLPRQSSGGMGQSGQQQGQGQTAQQQTRPQLRGVTELPPPSQLDIDWSPVLTHPNERILKLGNLVVFSGPPTSGSPNGGSQPGTPSEKPKFTRFFSGSTTKKRERLVLITSAGRLVIAAAGGNDKKAKGEVNLLTGGANWKSYVDSKGLTAWQLDTKDKHFTFEDPRATTSDPAGSKFSTQEWLDSVSQAKELALSQQHNGQYGSYTNDLDHSGVSSPADSIGGDAAMPMERHNLRQTLRKNTGDEEPLKGRKRFSKRHSKSGLAAVF